MAKFVVNARTLVENIEPPRIRDKISTNLKIILGTQQFLDDQKLNADLQRVNHKNYRELERQDLPHEPEI